MTHHLAGRSRRVTFHAPAVACLVALTALDEGCGRRADHGATGRRDGAGGAAPHAAAPPPPPPPSLSSPTVRESSAPSSPDLAAGASAAQPLSVEEQEQDPASEEITVKVTVEPPRRAHVWWGAKDFGLAPLEIKRPRASGPLDLVVRAPGYLTVHTRAFTDRDDRITVRLVPETDAPRMLGYRPP